MNRPKFSTILTKTFCCISVLCFSAIYWVSKWAIHTGTYTIRLTSNKFVVFFFVSFESAMIYLEWIWTANYKYLLKIIIIYSTKLAFLFIWIGTRIDIILSHSNTLSHCFLCLLVLFCCHSVVLFSSYLLESSYLFELINVDHKFTFESNDAACGKN